jgi:hypothetical protein
VLCRKNVLTAHSSDISFHVPSRLLSFEPSHLNSSELFLSQFTYIYIYICPISFHLISCRVFLVFPPHLISSYLLSSHLMSPFLFSALLSEMKSNSKTGAKIAILQRQTERSKNCCKIVILKDQTQPCGTQWRSHVKSWSKIVNWKFRCNLFGSLCKNMCVWTFLCVKPSLCVRASVCKSSFMWKLLCVKGSLYVQISLCQNFRV